MVGIKKLEPGGAHNVFDSLIVRDPRRYRGYPLLDPTAAPSGLGRYFAGGDFFVALLLEPRGKFRVNTLLALSRVHGSSDQFTSRALEFAR
jgi:hypothetical protein